MSAGDNEKVNSKSYIKKGFWISLGAIGGLGITGIIIISIFTLGLYGKEYFKYAIHLWNTLWYNQEQKEFKNCFDKEFMTFMKPTTFTKSGDIIIRKSPAQICKEKGFKPFPPYDETVN